MKFVFIVFQIFTFINLYSQSVNHVWHIHNPLPIDLVLSGNFGELRSGSFHTGIDFKTQQKENIQVLAVDDGWVSRIVVSKTGYGKAIYITHKNGYTTVYAHLRDFYLDVSEFVKNKQYELMSYEVDLSIPENKFIVKKGQLIGFSGNTGNSFGPHLHFEIRNNKEEPLNPLIFFKNIKDLYYPFVTNIWFYEFTDYTCNKEKNSFCVKPVLRNNKYVLMDTVYVYGKVGFGIEAFDNVNSLNRCGIYMIEMFLNNKKEYSVKFDKLSFFEQKYYKGFIDYKRLIKEKVKIYKLFANQNNKLSIYNHLLDNKGIFNFTNDGEVNKIKIVLKDFSRQQAIVEFFVKTKKIESVNKEIENSFENFDYYDSICFSKNFSISFEECNVFIPAYSLFDNACFTYKKYTDNIYLSNIHEIGNTYEPLIEKITIEIMPIVECSLSDKVLMAELDNNNQVKRTFKAIKTKNNFFKAEVSNFGRYVLLIDTIVPVCIPEKFSSNIFYNDNDTISFIIKDNLSDISKYNAYIDDNWALLEYDLKNNKVFYVMDKHRIQKNRTHKLIINLEDNVYNRSTFEYLFKY